MRASATTDLARSPYDESKPTLELQVHLRLDQETRDLNIRRIMILLSLLMCVAGSPLAKAQTVVDSGDSSSTATGGARRELPDLTYTRPTHEMKLRNYFFETVGPYPIVGAALAAGIGQADNTVPEWKQGAEGYGKRFASDFGIAAVSTTARYALAEAFKEDTLYYRCECRGLFPRLGHAVISTITARRGDDGRRVFSVPDLVAPYAGSMTAVYAWYPDRYNYKDAFRIGNYSLLGYLGGNIALEFFFGGPHSLLSRMHLNNAHGAPNSGSNP